MLITGVGVAPYNLQIDRRGQPEIQNLRDDVGGIKEKDGIRKPLAKALAQQLFIGRARKRAWSY